MSVNNFYGNGVKMTYILPISWSSFFFVPLCIKVYKKVQELETNKEKLHLAITNTTGTQNEDKTIVRTVGLH